MVKSLLDYIAKEHIVIASFVGAFSTYYFLEKLAFVNMQEMWVIMMLTVVAYIVLR